MKRGLRTTLSDKVDSHNAAKGLSILDLERIAVDFKTASRKIITSALFVWARLADKPG